MNEDESVVEQMEAALLRRVTNLCKDASVPINLIEGWRVLEENGINVLLDVLLGTRAYSKPFGTKSYTSLYTISYKMCVASGSDYSKALYDLYKDSVNNVVEYHLKSLISNINQADSFFIRAFINVYEIHKLFTKWMWRLFMHLDRGVVAILKLPSLTSVSLSSFYCKIYKSIKHQLILSIIDQINRERNGEMIDRDSLRRCIHIIEVMGVYSTDFNVDQIDKVGISSSQLVSYLEDFEVPFLQASNFDYEVFSASWSQSLDIIEYLERVHSAMEQQDSLVQTCMHTLTLPKLLKICHYQLVVTQAPKLQVGAKFLLSLICDEICESAAPVRADCQPANQRKSAHQYLRALFGLLRKAKVLGGSNPTYDLFPLFSAAVKEFVLEVTQKTVEEQKRYFNRDGPDDKKLSSSRESSYQHIDTLLRFIEKLKSTGLWPEPVFADAACEGLKQMINKVCTSASSFADQLASYVVSMLRNQKLLKLAEEEYEIKMDHCILLFSLLVNKDVFIEVFRTQLGRQLLCRSLEGSVDLDRERAVVSRLKAKCGMQFTSRVQGMLTDMLLASQVNLEFQNHCHVTQGCDEYPLINFNVLVLTNSFWPSQLYSAVTLPKNIEHFQQTFAEWYQSKHGSSSRRIKWCNWTGDAVVRADIAGRQYQIELTTAQAIVLVSFSCDNSEATIEQISSRTGIEDKRMLTSLLRSLSTPRQPLLVKTSDSLFRSNSSFKNKLRRIRIPKNEISSDCSRQDKNVIEDRTFAVSAAIVRVMKSRRTSSHQCLQAEIMRQLVTFEPEPRLIKKEVEKLIEREFLCRSREDPTVYIYIP